MNELNISVTFPASKLIGLIGLLTAIYEQVDLPSELDEEYKSYLSILEDAIDF